MLLDILTSAYEKATWVFNHVYAWLLYAVTFIGTFLGDSGVMYAHCIVAVVLADIVFGVWKSKKQGEGFKPRKAVKSLGRIALYLLIMILFHIVDIILEEDTIICMKAITIAVVVIELWSVMGNLCIVYPKIALFSIVQKFLLTTLSEKVNMSEEELKEAIQDAKDPKTKATNPFLKKDDKTINFEENIACSEDKCVNGIDSDTTLNGTDASDCSCDGE